MPSHAADVKKNRNMRNIHIKEITFITITGLFLFTACQKEPVSDNKDAQKSNPLIGTWICTDNNYTDTLLWWYICGENMEVYKNYKEGKLQLYFTDSTITATNTTPVRSLFNKSQPGYTLSNDTLLIISNYYPEQENTTFRFKLNIFANDSIQLAYIGSIVSDGYTLSTYKFKKQNHQL